MLRLVLDGCRVGLPSKEHSEVFRPKSREVSSTLGTCKWQQTSWLLGLGVCVFEGVPGEDRHPSCAETRSLTRLAPI